MTFKWSKKPFIYGFIYATFITILYLLSYEYLNIDITLPWQPISVLGIAVSFYLGFKNNSSYDRTWEARIIWGSIVNNSRTFASALNTFIQGPSAESITKVFIYRHIAWLTALRFQLRLIRDWEHKEDRIKGMYVDEIGDSYFEKLESEILNYISENEYKSYKNKKNIAAQILNTQNLELQRLKNENYFEDFRHMELYLLIKSFYDDQGKSERIKNFPFPRQYASVALWQTLIFCILIPFGMLSTFSESFGKVLLAIPFSALVIWIFFLMERIGDYSENPFEGTFNDVPITTIARSIEIDMLEIINDENIPPPILTENGFQL